MKGLVVVRGFHFARAAILTCVAGLGKNVIALGRFRMRIGGLGIRPELMQGFREYRRLHDGREWGEGCFHKVRCRLLVSVTVD